MAKKNKSPSPNEQRSNVKNPNNPAYHEDQANRAAQREANRSKRPVGSNAAASS